MNIYLSFFHLNKYRLKQGKIKTHENTFKEIIKDRKKIINSKIPKKNLFNSFVKFKIKIREIIFNEYKLKNFLSEDEIHKVMFGLNRLFFLNS